MIISGSTATATYGLTRPTPRLTVDLDISVPSGFRVDLYAEGLGNPTSLSKDTVQKLWPGGLSKLGLAELFLCREDIITCKGETNCGTG